MKKLFVFILLLLFFILLPAYTFADIRYTVKKGDSFYKISKKFGISIKDIKTKNNIASNRIKPGIKLLIPEQKKNQDVTHDASPAKPTQAKLDNKDETSVNTARDITQSYKVKKGDTLLKIAKNNSLSVKDLKEINNLKTAKIKPGQKLILSKEKSQEQPKKHDAIISAAHTEKEKAKEKTEYYTVKKEDSLASISKKYSISIEEIKDNNNLKSIKLKPGQQLLVKRVGPKTYVVKKGDSLYRIARRFDIEIDELRDINELETDSLKPGQIIFLEPEKEVDKTILPEAQIKKEIKEPSESEEVSKMGMRDKLILFAKKLINIPYRFGGNNLFGIDCSGFVQKVYGMIGINLPRSARQQFKEGELIDKAELSIGDLVFFRTYAPFPSHVGIYLGDDLFIHASSAKKKVTIDNLTTPYYLKRYIGAKRVIETGEQEIIDGG
jgi:peptidoglycan endopeptidase LytE